MNFHKQDMEYLIDRLETCVELLERDDPGARHWVVAKLLADIAALKTCLED